MDHLFIFEGRLCQCLIERSSSNRRALKVSLYEFCQHRRIFKKLQFCSIDVSHEIKEIIGIHVKLNVFTGFYTVILHASSSTQNACRLVLVLDRNFSSYRVVTQLNSPSSSSQDAYFIDGPGLIQSNTTKNLIFHRLAEKQKELVLKESVSVKSMLWSGYCKDIGSVAVFLSIIRNDQTEHFTFFFHSHSEDCETVDSIVFFPKELQNLVAANVIQISKGGSEASAYYSEVITLTSEGFLIYLQEGRIMWALPTTISNLRRPALFSWSAFSLNTQFSAIYNNEIITFINLKERKILDQVTDVTAVYQDDFVGCGRTQILCLLPGFSLESSSDWLFTDKGVWLFDQKSTTEECHTEHQPAVFALQKRLQGELVSLHRKSHFVDKERSEFISNTWKSLLHQRLFSPANRALEEQKPIQISNTSLISIEKIWQVVLDDDWLVGVRIVNTYDSPLHNLSLSLSSVDQDGKQPQKVLYSQSQWLIAENPECRSSKVIKRGHSKVLRSKAPPTELQSGEKGVVACRTDIPYLVSQPEFRCEVVLTYTICCDSDKNGSELEQRQYQVQQCCGTVTLETSSLIEGKYNLEEPLGKTTLDHWCKKAVSLLTQVTCHLEMKTTWSNVSRLSDWLVKLCDFHYNADQNVYQSMSTAFSRMKLVIHSHPSHNKAQFTVHANSDKQIMLLIHHLYARLADDIVIMSLLKEEEEHEGLQIAIEAIRREIEITKPKQRENATGSCHLGDPELPESDVSGALLVNNIRENFRKRKESTFRSKVDSEQSNNKMNENRFYEIQRNTDEAIAKLKL